MLKISQEHQLQKLDQIKGNNVMIHPLTMAFSTLRSIDDDDDYNKDNKDGDDDNEGAGCEYHRSGSQL